MDHPLKRADIPKWLHCNNFDIGNPSERILYASLWIFGLTDFEEITRSH